jgi:alpha-mannosidase
MPPMPDCSYGSVIISNVKPAEHLGNGIVFRCFESIGAYSELILPRHEGQCWFESDLMEDNIGELGSVTVKFRPFEIKTLILRYQH